MIQVSLPVFIIIWTVISIIVFITLVFIVKTLRRNQFLVLDKDHITNQRSKIVKLLQSNNPTDLVMAIIEADKLLDYFLKQKNFSGETLGERLKMACYNNKELKKVWPAHILRNKIVHDHDLQLTAREANKYWQDYNKAYKILAK